MDPRSPTLEEIQKLHQAGDLNSAKSGYLRLLEFDKNNADAMHMLGLLFAEEGDLEQAEQYLQKAVIHKPDEIQFQLHLGNILKTRKRYQEAETVLNNALRLKPDFAAALNNLGTVFYLQNKLQEAIDVYQVALDVQANYIDAYYNLGLAYIKAQQIEAAINCFKALLELAPDHPGAHFQLARLFMGQEKFLNAIAELTKIVEVHPHHFETQSNLATCYMRIGHMHEAEVHYQKALALNPNDLQVLFNLGVVCMSLGKSEESIHYYLSILNVDANNFAAHANVAIAYLAKRNALQALKHFKECLRLQPSNKVIQHHIHILQKDPTVSESPAEYIETLFDTYAENYDQHMLKLLHYKVPESMAKLLAKHCDFTKDAWQVLDLGCGTGLSGEFFLPFLEKNPHLKLTGVDLSAKMLALAEQKHCYQELICADVLSYLHTQHNKFQLVIAADVMVYFGDLNAFFASVYAVLVPRGLFLFNIELGEEDFALADTGRFTHSEHYIDDLIKQTAFTVIDQAKLSLRMQNNENVRGQLYLLTK